MQSSTVRALAASLFLGLAALASPALAAPQVITTCQVISQPGSYVLGNNLTATGDCLQVATNFVTIDLNGFAITGNGTGVGILELRASPFRGITLRNGTITKFFQGILFHYSTGMTVERIYAADNGFTAISLGDHAIVRDCTTVDNGGTGIQVGYASLVRNNVSSMNGSGGIIADNGGNVIGNTTFHNKGTGIASFTGSNVVHNVARNNGNHGIFVDCPSAVVSNAATLNGGQNIDLLGGACESGHNSDL
jgi:hypothetical protein